MTEVIAVVGPTASGKTALAIRIAEHLHTEIISADSMQVYRGMEIGTGAPSSEELRRVPHHFVSIWPPETRWSAGAFEQAARPIVKRLNDAAKPAVVVGGSGLYVQALIDGLIDVPASDPSIRRRLQADAEKLGADALYARLQRVDPDYAEAIHSNDLRRIVRALEIYEGTGVPLGGWHSRLRDGMRPLRSLQIAIEHPRQALYNRINARVDEMIATGFLDELRALLDQGYAEHLEKLRTLGYRECLAYLRGEVSLESAVEAMKMNTRRYAKRQLSWFRGDDRIHWLPTGTDAEVWARTCALLNPHIAG
ncbi:MAG: tRNA dimethylallyltransferase [Candidatus Hydrogenedentota bacterium]